MIEPHGTVADLFYVAHGVRHEEDRDAALAEFVNLTHAALAEIYVANSERFVDKEDLRINVDCNSECEAHAHAAGVRLNRLVDEIADLRELLNERKLLLHFLLR